MQTNRHYTAKTIGTRCLLWLMLVTVLLLGLTVTRQQTLGALHFHADMGGGSPWRVDATRSATPSDFGSSWLNRWRQQQVFGHGHMALGQTSTPSLQLVSRTQVRRDADRHQNVDHHLALERHHHTGNDQSVIALDGAAEAADAGNVGAIILIPIFAGPSQGLFFAGMTSRNGSWPITRAVSFASRKVAPLLRPPSV